MFEVIELGGQKVITAPAPLNHVYVVDCSYSMSYELAAMRQQLKNVISLVAKPEDTFTTIWFSGTGQAGVVFENVPVKDLSTVSALHNAIDRFIRPVGATGFVDPLKLCKDVASRLDKGKLLNMAFMTDGYDNMSNRSEIVPLVQALQDTYQSITFIEYGYYADRELLAKMAESVGGNHVFADGMTSYEKVLTDAIKKVPRVNNIEVNVNKRANHCVFLYEGQIRIVPVVDGVASVPEDTQRVYSIVPKDILQKQLSQDHLYLVLYYAAKTVNDKLVWDCLKAIGDVRLVEMYQNAFTKQELSDFEAAVSECVFDENVRFLNGKSKDAVPNKNAKTVVDLLSLLAATDGTALVTSSPYWKYERTGKARVSADEDKVYPRFVESPMAEITLNKLVFNSERPNISINTTRDGIVEVGENSFGIKSVPSKITRNYTIIRDGIKNVQKLPVTLNTSDLESFNEFNYEIVQQSGDKSYVVFDLMKTPVINRAGIEAVRLEDLKHEIIQSERAKAKQKVINYLISQHGGSSANVAKLAADYGEDAAKWLSSIGVRDYGFSPVGTTGAESGDEYMAILVESKIKGLSSLPSIDAVKKKVAEKKKLNAGDSLILEALNDYENLTLPELEKIKKFVVTFKRVTETNLAGIVYSLILGRKWFGDDEVISTTINLNGVETEMTLQKSRKAISK